MATTESLCKIIGVTPSKFTREENLFLEAELFIRICEKLNEIFEIRYNINFNSIKYNTEMESTMLEANFIRHLINDILLTEEYTLQGIAYYTQTSEEIIYDIAAGNNLMPSLPLSRKIIEIHRIVRPELYRDILNKMITIHSA